LAKTVHDNRNYDNRATAVGLFVVRQLYRTCTS